VVAALGGTLDEYPDYVAPEEGELTWEEIEAELDALLAEGPLMVGGRKGQQPRPN